VLKNGDLARAGSTALGDQPRIELRASLDLQLIQKVADEQRRQSPQPHRRQPIDPLMRRACDLHHVNEAVGKVEPDRISVRFEPSATAVAEEAPDLAEAPAKLGARVIGDVPQKLAETTAGDGLVGKRQIRNQGAHFTRRRQHQRHTLAADRHRSKQAHMETTGVHPV